jgi:hypothetical protein
MTSHLHQKILASRLFTTQRWLLLVIVGLLSWVVYQIGWLHPYSFSALGVVPLLNIAMLTQDQPIGQAGYVFTVALSFGLYYLAYRICRSQRSRSMWLVLIGIVWAINISMVNLYPIGAADIFDSLMHGRMTSVYNANPFYTAPNAFPNDVLAPYVGWSATTATYGPLFEWITAGVTRISGDDILTNVIVFKLVLFAFYAGSAIVIALLLKRRDPDRALAAVCLFALNPLVIYSTVGNGHNDILMVFFIALGALLLDRGRYTSAALAFTAGGALKFISIALIPIVLVIALRENRSWKSSIKFLIVTGLACAGLMVIVSGPFYRGGDFFGFGWKFTLYTSSWPSVIQAALQDPIGLEASRLLVNRAAMISLALLIFYLMWRVYRREDWRFPQRAALLILLFYLMVVCAWFQAWYVQWALVLAAIAVDSNLSRLTMLLTYSVMWKSIFIDYSLYSGYWIAARDQRELATIVATFGVVWVYALYLLARRIFSSSRLKPLLFRQKI